MEARDHFAQFCSVVVSSTYISVNRQTCGEDEIAETHLLADDVTLLEKIDNGFELNESCILCLHVVVRW